MALESLSGEGRVVRFPARGGREPWVTKAQLAAHFQVHEKTVERWAAAGMPVMRAGTRTVRFQVSACEAWLESRS
jgi:phage terminase Nu1 subunit (DNA packaging protein)